GSSAGLLGLRLSNFVAGVGLVTAGLLGRSAQPFALRQSHLVRTLCLGFSHLLVLDRGYVLVVPLLRLHVFTRIGFLLGRVLIRLGELICGLLLRFSGVFGHLRSCLGVITRGQAPRNAEH